MIAMPKLPFPMPPKFPKLPLEIVVEGAKRIGKALKVLFTGNDDIGKQQPFIEKKSTVDEIGNLHRILSDYRKDVKDASAEILAAIKDECNSFFEKTISQFEGYSKSFDMQHMTGTYKKKFNRMTDEIEDVFDDIMSKRLSIDDSECMSILKMMPGQAKMDRMADYKRKVFTEAVDSVCRKIRYCMEDFFDTVEDTFTNKLNTLSDTINSRSEAFEVLSAEGERSKDEMDTVLGLAHCETAKANVAENIIQGGAA